MISQDKNDRTSSTDVRHLSMATRGAYFIAGFTISAWAPLVPYAKFRAGLDDGALGLLLLCLGLGSVTIMPLTGMLTDRFGCRRVIVCFALLGIITLPLLAALNSPIALALALLFFGAAAGGLDVAAAIQAVMVQNRAKRQVMPAMLAFYSIGCIVGPAVVSFLLYYELSPLVAALSASAVIIGILLLCQHHLAPKQLEAERQSRSLLVGAKGIVLLLACMCFIVFLVEGAIMDWGALFLADYKGFDHTLAGVGFAVFSAALALGRLIGTRLIRLVGGERQLIIIGCIISFCSIMITLFVFSGKMALLGFFLIGFGNANVIPLLFSATGKQKVMPAAAAVSAVSSLGYAGILLGPALIGFIAHFTNLFLAFLQLSILMLLVAYLSTKVVHNKKYREHP